MREFASCPRLRHSLKDNPINAYDLEGNMIPYNSRAYFNQPNLTGFGGMLLLTSFIEKMGIEEGLEDVFDHERYIYSTSDILFVSNNLRGRQSTILPLK